MHKIMVPVDDSAAAGRAVRHAIAIARGLRARIVLLNVRESLERRYRHGLRNPDARRDLWRDAEAEAADAREALSTAKVPYDFRVVFGRPAEVIARVARDEGCQEIVMGTRGVGPLGTLFAGSTSSSVVKMAGVPVTLVK